MATARTFAVHPAPTDIGPEGSSVPRLSIVIPALGQLDSMEATLVSVLENRPHDCEVLVMHHGDYEDPYDLRAEVAFVAVAPGASLAECLEVARGQARGPILHLLAPGVRVRDGWCEAALHHFRAAGVASVTPLALDAANGRLVCSAGLGYHLEGLRRHLCAGAEASLVTQPPAGLVGPSRLAAFYRLESLSPGECLFDGWIGDEFADVDLALRLRRSGCQNVWEPASQVLADQTIDEMCVCRGYDRGLRAERLFWRHARAMGRPQSLVLHTLAMLGELGQACVQPRVFAQLWGRLAATVERPTNPDFVEIELQNAAPRDDDDRARDAGDAAPERRSTADSRLRIDGPHLTGEKRPQHNGAGVSRRE